MHDVAFIIVTWNARDLLLDCLDSLFKQVALIDYEVLVVDNGSKDGTVEAVKQKFDSVRIIANKENVGFAAGNNQGFKEMSSRYAVLLNSDTIVLGGTFEKLVKFLDEHQDVAVVGPQLINKDGSKQNCFHNYPSLVTEVIGLGLLKSFFPVKYPSKRRNYEEPLETDSILGACLMVRKEVIEQVGYMDDGYFFFLEETDWCFRMRNAGWKIYHIPDVKIVHLHGESTKKKLPVATWIEYYRSNYRFFKKNLGLLSLIVVVFVRFLKLNINFILMFLCCVISFFSIKKFNRKLITYGALLLWHLKLCPKNMGLKNV
ncbi:MAG: glycosyltransferase family 2 protein [Candidatus Anammoxibacter sp.]